MGLLRLLLALAVVCAHTPIGFQFTGGRVAVQTFFMISGFYIAMILEDGYKSSYLFWSNRLLRLLPVYYLVSVFTAIAVLGFGVEIYGNFDGFINLPVLAKIFLIFTNVSLLFQDVTMFLGVNDGVFEFVSSYLNSSPPLYHYLLVPQAWSLGIEISFYLLAPTLCRWTTQRLGVLIFLGLVLRLALYAFGFKNDPWNYRFFPTELGFFLVGVIAYKLYSKHHARIVALKYRSKLFILNFMWIFTAIFAHIDMSKGVLMLFYFTFMALTLPIIFEVSRTWKVDRILGELSYPLYICHMLVIALAGTIWTAEKSYMFGIVECVLSIVFAFGLYFYVDRPIGTMRAKRKADFNV